MVFNAWVSLCGIWGGENDTVSGLIWLLWFSHQPSFSQCHILVCDYRAEYGAPISCAGGLVFKSPSEELLSEIYLDFISPPGKDGIVPKIGSHLLSSMYVLNNLNYNVFGATDKKHDNG